jgi:uncharacterized membrane protein
MLIWASSFVALKLAFRGYDPMVVIFGRMLVASICFAPFVPRFRSAAPLLRKDLRPLLFMALCEPCLYFIFEARALELTSASQAGMISAILPLTVAIGARVVLGEVLSVQTMIGFGVAIAGACWLSMAGQPSVEAPNPVLGNFLEFMAMVCATGYIISLKRLSARYSPFFLTAVQAFVGGVFFFPFLFFPATVTPDRFVPFSLPSGNRDAGQIRFHSGYGDCLSRCYGYPGRLRIVQLRRQPDSGQSCICFYQSDSGIYGHHGGHDSGGTIFFLSVHGVRPRFYRHLSQSARWMKK